MSANTGPVIFLDDAVSLREGFQFVQKSEQRQRYVKNQYFSLLMAVLNGDSLIFTLEHLTSFLNFSPVSRSLNF